MFGLGSGRDTWPRRIFFPPHDGLLIKIPGKNPCNIFYPYDIWRRLKQQAARTVTVANLLESDSDTDLSGTGTEVPNAAKGRIVFIKLSFQTEICEQVYGSLRFMR